MLVVCEGKYSYCYTVAFVYILKPRTALKITGVVCLVFGQYSNYFLFSLYENKLNAVKTIFQDLQKKFKDRVSYKVANFFGMGKLAFQDKMDNGNRLKELLGELNTDETGS